MFDKLSIQVRHIFRWGCHPLFTWALHISAFCSFRVRQLRGAIKLRCAINLLDMYVYSISFLSCDYTTPKALRGPRRRERPAGAALLPRAAATICYANIVLLAFCNFTCVCIYIYIYIYIIYIYIYIYREREREMCIYIYIYIYVHAE